MPKKKIDVTGKDADAKLSLGDVLRGAGIAGITEAASGDVKDDKPVNKSKAKDRLHVRIEKKGRGGKVVTIIAGFTVKTGQIEELSRTLKHRCGVGGSVKDREIVLQGNMREKTVALLHEMGYPVR